ncbi:MAG TPA: hypothetical protein PLJ27_02845, partial [Polyangiaceae bacterium]|nr:hypothetical protein [Polyangiaceae bacterium]
SNLTMEDLHVLTERMANALVNMFHGRIKYPWQRQQERKPAQSFTTPRPGEVAPLAVPPPPPPVEEPTHQSSHPTTAVVP